MRCLLSLFIACFPIVASAQELPVQKYTTRNGLGNSIVYRITQTRNGFLWFSTDDGLTRFDGSAFTNYTAKDGLRSSFIFGTLETDSSLLVSSFGAGVMNFLPDTCYQLNSDKGELKYPIDLFHNKAGLWSIDHNGIVFHFEGNSFKRFLVPGMEKCVTSKLLETSSGSLLLATGRYLSRYVAGNKLEKLTIAGLPVNTGFNTILELKDHTILVATDSVLYAIDPPMNNARPLMNGNFNHQWASLMQDHDGNVWVATLGGELWRFSQDLKKKERLFQNVIINDIFEDSDNNIWLATYGQGAWCIPNLYMHAYTTGRTIATDLALDKRHHRVIIADPGQGTVVLDKGLVTAATGSELPVVLRMQGITTVFCEGDECIAGGSITKLFRKRNNHLESIKLNGVVASMYKNEDGYYWVGLRMKDGLVRIHPDFKQITRIEQFKGYTVRSIAADGDGRILAGTNQGLFLQSGTTWKCIDRRNGLPDNYVNVVCFDKKNNCHWIGTNEGICLLQSGQTITSFNDPLAKLRCNAIVCDRQNNVWMATTAGLVKYTNGLFSLFSGKDGMPSDIYKLCYHESADKLYILAPNQLFEIAVTQFMQQQSKRIPTVTVDAILPDGKSIPHPGSVIRFSHVPEYVTLKISIPVFKNSGAWNIYSRINGHAWQLAEKKNELLFYQLPFGQFNIELKAMNKELRASPVVAIHFNNPKPLYLRSWFLLLAGCVLLLPVILVTRYITRRNSQRKEQALLAGQQQLELEQKALLNMLNPHFMNNALNSIQTFVTRNDQRSTLNYLSRFAKLMRVNLELLETNTITLEKELQNVTLYLTFEKLRFSDNLTYTIELDPGINADELMIPSLVLQPFVENAIWHGVLPTQKPGCVSIRVSRKEHSLYILIEDDGIGLTASRKRREMEQPEKPSRGLKIIQGRFALLNKRRKGYSFTIRDKQELGHSQTGTRVEIILPYNV